MYIQLQYGLQAIGKLAAEKPELRERQPYKAVYEKDMAWLGKVAADFERRRSEWDHHPPVRLCRSVCWDRLSKHSRRDVLEFLITYRMLVSKSPISC